MKRVKKPKKSAADKPAKTPHELVSQTNYLNLAIMVRILYMCYGWRSKRLSDFCEAYLALIREITDRRSTVHRFVKDTFDLTGVDVYNLLDSVVERKRP